MYFEAPVHCGAEFDVPVPRTGIKYIWDWNQIYLGADMHRFMIRIWIVKSSHYIIVGELKEQNMDSVLSNLRRLSSLYMLDGMITSC